MKGDYTDMGWLMRDKLKSLPISNNDIQTVKSIMAQLSYSTNISFNAEGTLKIKNKLKDYSQSQLKEAFGNFLPTLAQAEAYLIDDKNSRADWGMRMKWKLEKGMLVNYDGSGLAASLGVWLPMRFILRISEASWIVYEVPRNSSFEDE